MVLVGVVVRMVFVVMMVLVEKVHWAQRMPLVDGLSFVQLSQTKEMVVDWLILAEDHLSLARKDVEMLVECQKAPLVQVLVIWVVMEI